MTTTKAVRVRGSVLTLADQGAIMLAVFGGLWLFAISVGILLAVIAGGTLLALGDWAEAQLEASERQRAGSYAAPDGYSDPAGLVGERPE